MLPFYEKVILPRLINLACSGSTIQKQREKIILHAEGDVVEIGVGSGLNFSYYDWDKINSYTAIDPSMELWDLRKKENIPKIIEPVYYETGAEEIPVNDYSADSVVMTYCFCSVEDPVKTVNEIIRILRPNGKLIFSEHALSPDQKVRKWQNRINPFWKRISGGCNLNRNTLNYLEKGGFDIDATEGMQLPGWKSSNWHIWGVIRLK